MMGGGGITGDEDIIVEYDDCACINWKEILSLTDVHFKVNSFLLKNNVCDNVNFILPKSMHLCVRFIDNTSIGGPMKLVDKDGKHEGDKGGSGAIKQKIFGSD